MQLRCPKCGSYRVTILQAGSPWDGRPSTGEDSINCEDCGYEGLATGPAEKRPSTGLPTRSVPDRGKSRPT
jgi:DNA-directed RNA polymerase subunit RPC12/RpoP